MGFKGTTDTDKGKESYCRHYVVDIEMEELSYT